MSLQQWHIVRIVGSVMMTTLPAYVDPAGPTALRAVAGQGVMTMRTWCLSITTPVGRFSSGVPAG
jgi:hypothetical protein